MLTILAPIEITAKNSIVNDNESFAHHIRAGYDLMRTHIDETDLLHVVNTPPEIYIAEGEGYTSILSQNNVNQHNYEKVEIINNLINTIINSAEVDMTYQMRTFVTDALYKLGIRDDRKFMQAFYKLVDEYHSKNKIVDTYFYDETKVEELKNSLTELINNKTVDDSRHYEDKSELNLYESIFNRLQTGAIYQIVSNFNHTREYEQISAEEYLVSEQTNTALNMLINNIAQSAEFNSPEIIYNYDNRYEQEYVEGDVTSEQTNNVVTAAVFLDMIRNLYSTGYDRFTTDNNAYYDFTSTIYNSSNNTYHRLYNESFVSRVESRVVDEYETNNTAEIVNVENNVDEISQEERLINVFNEINIQNAERRAEYTKLINQIEKKYNRKKKRGSFKETIKDAKLALEDRGRLIEKLEERQEENQQLDAQMKKEIERIFPNEAARIFEVVSDYYQNITEAGASQMTQQNISMLINNIEEVRRLNEASIQKNINIKNEIKEGAELVHQTIENAPEINNYQNITDAGASQVTQQSIRNVTNNIEQVRQLSETNIQKNINISNEIKEGARLVHQTMENAHETLGAADRQQENIPEIERVHRVNENISSEEIAETLDQYRKNIQRQIRDEVKQETENIQNTTTNKVINTYNTTRQEIETPDIRRLVQEGVNAQLGTISDKVYTKIERRLASEKSRRGY